MSFLHRRTLRDTSSDLALHFLNKIKITVVRISERKETEFFHKTIRSKPIAHNDQFTLTWGSVALAMKLILNGSGKLSRLQAVGWHCGTASSAATHSANIPYCNVSLPVPAAQFLIQLGAVAPEKAAEDGSHTWPLPHMSIWRSRLLV